MPSSALAMSQHSTWIPSTQAKVDAGVESDPIEIKDSYLESSWGEPPKKSKRKRQFPFGDLDLQQKSKPLSRGRKTQAIKSKRSHMIVSSTQGSTQELSESLRSVISRVHATKIKR